MPYVVAAMAAKSAQTPQCAIQNKISRRQICFVISDVSSAVIAALLILKGVFCRACRKTFFRKRGATCLFRLFFGKRLEDAMGFFLHLVEEAFPSRE